MSNLLEPRKREMKEGQGVAPWNRSIEQQYLTADIIESFLYELVTRHDRGNTLPPTVKTIIVGIRGRDIHIRKRIFRGAVDPILPQKKYDRYQSKIKKIAQFILERVTEVKYRSASYLTALLCLVDDIQYDLHRKSKDRELAEHWYRMEKNVGSLYRWIDPTQGTDEVMTDEGITLYKELKKII